MDPMSKMCLTHSMPEAEGATKTIYHINLKRNCQIPFLSHVSGRQIATTNPKFAEIKINSWVETALQTLNGYEEGLLGLIVFRPRIMNGKGLM